MKKKAVLSLILALGLSAGCDLSEDDGYTDNPRNNGIPAAQLDYVFDLDALPTVTIYISTNQWNILLTNFDFFDDNEIFVRADFSFNKNGEQVDLQNIGFRIRGNMSRRRPEYPDPNLHGVPGNVYLNAHFRLGFNEFVPGQHLYGLRNLNLKWFKDDPNYVREIFGYDLYRRFGIAYAPRASYTRLYIRFKESGETVYFGPYMLVESLDKSYLQDRFTNSSQGYLWKCKYGANYESASILGNNIGMEEEWPGGKFTPVYDLKSSQADFTNLAKPQLQAFVNGLNSYPSGSTALRDWLAANLDVDGFLRYLAVSLMLGNWDSFYNNGANHYIYFDESGLAHFIPYDLDNIMGTGITAYGNPATQTVDQWFEPYLVLSDKVLSISEYYRDYTNYLAQLSLQDNEYFDIIAATNRILAWRTLIDPGAMSGIQVAGWSENNFNSISDLPGQGWTDYPYYRLFSGDASGDGVNPPGANFLKSRQMATVYELSLPFPNREGWLRNTSSLYIRGEVSSGGWSAGDPMFLVGHHTWEIVVSNLSGSEQYKFTAHRTSWAYPNWGDEDSDGAYAELNSSTNIVNPLAGTVLFRFNDQTLNYTASNL